MKFYVVEIDGEFQVSFTGLETVEKVRKSLWVKERLIHFVQFGEGENVSGIEDAVGVIDALTCLDSTREVLERLLTAVYRLGR